MKQKYIIPEDHINSLEHATPFFVLNTQAVTDMYFEYHKRFPGIDIYYAMKSNSELPVLRALQEVGCGFEVASYYELEILKKLGVNPKRIIYGTAVKPFEQIKAAHRYGVDRFSVDSSQEVKKIAQAAPGSRVFVRALSDDSESVFSMSDKFGVPLDEVVDLIVEAKSLGLKTYGISFNVGSQAGNAMAWAQAIESLVPIISELKDKGIMLDVINLGGGYPWEYQPNLGTPTLTDISVNIARACQLLPYNLQLIMEPGRGLVAHSSVLVASVIGKVKRRGKTWLYLDAGTYNALFEAMAHQGLTPYRVSWLDIEDDKSLESMTLTGPTGDGLDVITHHSLLPSSLEVGDRLVFHDVGAYTICMAGPFNGFPVPPLYTYSRDLLRNLAYSSKLEN